MENRRDFLKKSTLFGTSILLSNLVHKNLMSYMDSDFLKNEDIFFNQLNQNYELVDDYLPGHLLIQAYEFSIGSSFTFSAGMGKNISILCNTLKIDGEFQNLEKDITVFCNNVICENNAVINISGKIGNEIPVPQLSDCNGDTPNGTNADNIDPTGAAYDLHGGNAGNCSLYFSKIEGSLKIHAKGGNGSNGEIGGGACNGRDGRELGYDTRGEDGKLPGANGKGANGGKGGNGGKITLASIVGITSQQLNYVSGQTTLKYPEGDIGVNVQMGYGGEGGKGGDILAHGGNGGPGGLISHRHTRGGGIRGGDREEYYTYGPDRAPGGTNNSNVNSAVGELGEDGEIGKIGLININSPYKEMVSKIPSSFLRLLILKGEYFYINNQYLTSAKIFKWITELKVMLDSLQTELTFAPTFSPYLEAENISFLNQHFNSADLYLNQLNLGMDFFGNVNSYVTLLDNEFINDRITSLRTFFEGFEDFSNSVVVKNTTYLQCRAVLENQRTANNQKISQLKGEIDRQNKFIFDLNADIMQRQNELVILKNQILMKEAAFRSAVEHASDGCNLMGALTAIGSIVSLVAGVASGIGAIGAAFTIINDTSKLKNNFISKVDSIGPWISPSKWKSVFNDGGNDNLIKQIDGIKKETTTLRESAQVFKDNVLGDNGKSQNLLAVTYDTSHPSLQAKEDFIKQMKVYLDEKDDNGNPKFPEAKIYEDEVLNYIDFCDLLNQKRYQFTAAFLNILSLNTQIDQLKIDNDNVTHALLNNDATKVSSQVKSMVLDSYYKTLQFALKLIYLQKKSIDYFTLDDSPFDAQYYDMGIKGIFINYINENQPKLVNYLNNSGAGRSLGRTEEPIVIKKKDYPLAFKQFIKGEVNDLTRKKIHTITFPISPVNNYFLPAGGGNWSEIYITSAKVFLPGVKTNHTIVSFNLQHSGVSLFFRSDRSQVVFSHKQILKGLTYNIANNSYSNEFSQINGDYLVNGRNPFVGISPFANWTIQIDENVIVNEGLSLKDVSEIKITFDFYYRPFNNY